MSKIDYQALREKAEKATCGVWSLEYGEERFDAGDALIHREVVGYIPICRIEGAHPESGFDKISKWNSRPMLNSSPQPIQLPSWRCLASWKQQKSA